MKNRNIEDIRANTINECFCCTRTSKDCPVCVWRKRTMIEMEQIPLTPLAEYLDKLIRERGGYLPSVGGESWLEKKAGEIRKLVKEERK